MHMQLVHLWSARAKYAVIRRIASSTLPRRATSLSNSRSREVRGEMATSETRR